MTAISIRSLQGEEFLEVLYNQSMYAFHSSPPFEDKEEWARIVRERKGVTFHALYEDNQAVACAAYTAMTQNVRGKLFPAAAVWGVVTSPAARRKGYSRQLLASLLTAGKEAGKVISDLYPFRESFYERQGYVTMPIAIIACLSPQALVPLLKKDPGGEVELRLIGEAFDTYRDFLAKLRPRVHGMGFFDVGDRLAAQSNRLWAALAKVEGEIEGVMLYNLKGEEPTKFQMRVTRFYYSTSRGRYLLLDWIARHADQADQVEICLPPFEHPETWLADMKVKIESQRDAAMGRVLNVAMIHGMTTGEGSFSARVVDPACPFNEGKWKFASLDGKLQVSRTDEADCELTIQGLTALVFGTHDPQDLPLRGWGDPAPGLQSVMRSIFPPMTPFLHEIF